MQTVIKLLFVFILLFLCSSPILSQTSKLDSLKQEFSQHQRDTHAIKIIEAIVKSSANSDSVSFYANRGMRLALELDKYQFFLKVSRATMMNLYPKGKYEALISCVEKVLKEAALRKDTITIAKSNNNLGIFYRRIGQQGKSINHLENAVSIYETIKDSSLIASTYSALANSYKGINDFEKALVYQLKGLRICEAKKNGKNCVLLCGNIGTLYFHQQNYQQALEYYDQGLNIARKDSLYALMGWMFNGMGAVLYEKGELEKTIEIYKKAIKYNKEYKVWRSLGYSYNDIGVAFKELGEYEEAFAYYNKALKIRQKEQEPTRIAETLTNIAKLNTLIGKPKAAFKYLEKAEQVVKTQETWENKLKLFEIYAENYQALGDSKNARKYLAKAYLLKDTIINEQQTKTISNLQIKYNLEKKQDSIKNLTTKNEIIATNLEQEQTISSLFQMITFIALILAGALFYLFRLKRLQNQQLANNNQNLLQLNEALTGELTEKENELMTPEFLANKTLTLSSNGKEVLKLRDIICFKAEGKAVQIFTKTKNHWDWVTLGSYEKILPKQLFLKIHRSYVVNILHVKNRKSRSLQLTNGQRINIGNTLRNQVNETLDRLDLN